MNILLFLAWLFSVIVVAVIIFGLDNRLFIDRLLLDLKEDKSTQYIIEDTFLSVFLGSLIWSIPVFMCEPHILYAVFSLWGVLGAR